MKVARRLSEARASPAARLKRFHGACACGSVRFVARLDPTRRTRCICARCRGQGLTVVHAEGDAFRLLTGAAALTETLEYARTPHHFFCGRCGEPVFGLGPLGRAGPVSVNVALLERGDPDAIADYGSDA